MRVAVMYALWLLHASCWHALGFLHASCWHDLNLYAQTIASGLTTFLEK